MPSITPLEVIAMMQDLARAELARSMKLLISRMAKALVDFPDDVTVEAETNDDSTVLILQVAPSDLGKVIGKQGRTARSIRTILGAASMKAQHRFALDIRQESRDSLPDAAATSVASQG